MRPAQLLVVTATLGLVPGLAGGQTLPKPTQSTTLSTQKELIDISNLKLATTMHVPVQRTIQGARVSLSALLLGPAGRGLKDKQVTFRIRDWNGKLVQSCPAMTDSLGRASCFFKVASQGTYMRTFQVEAFFPGDSRFLKSVRTNRLEVKPPAHLGGMLMPDGVQVSVEDNDGRLGHVGTLRATVTRNGTPVTSGRVEFWANGSPLGAADVDAGGLARLHVRVQRAQVGTFLYSANYLTWTGPIQAWYVPATGSSIYPGLGVGVGYFTEADLCRHLKNDTNRRCSVASEQPTLLRPRRAEITVKQGEYGQATVTTQPRIEVTFPTPPNPAPNSDCQEGYSHLGGLIEGGVPQGGCRRTCERLYYVTLGTRGTIAVKQWQSDSSTEPACSWKGTPLFELDKEAFRVAHDHCADKARLLRLPRWNHTVYADLPRGVAAVFLFRDPRTEYVDGGWKYKATWEPVIRETTAQIQVKINCRQ